MREKTPSLAGRKILITGGASGIGLATARLFAREGAQVAALDIDAAGLAALEKETGAVTAFCDLTDADRIAADRIAAAVEEAANALGGLDGVVNCAGLSIIARVAELTPDAWRRTMAVNLDAPYLICRAALPWLEAAGFGTIVTVASGQALLPNAPGVAAYAASKAGVLAFTKALAAELAPHIRCNVLCPGIVDTPMVADILGDGPRDEIPFVRQYALGRVAQPDEMAQAILFLTSDASSYITGATLAADGGRTFH